MILAFEIEELRTICEDSDFATKRFGAAVASQLRGRLADVRAAMSSADLLVGNPRFSGQRSEYLTIDLGPEEFMVWTANHVTAKLDANGQVDWTRVTRVRLLNIEVAG
jgi:hypothetical protein